jgi:hypothetical protein
VSDILTVLKLTPERLCELFAERGATVTPDMLSRWAEWAFRRRRARGSAVA